MSLPPEIQACSNLFSAVLARAVLDALGYTSAGGAPMPCEKHRARYWFEHGGKDFNLICWLAGRDPRDVRKGVLRAIKSGEYAEIRAKYDGSVNKGKRNYQKTHATTFFRGDTCEK